MIDATSPSAPDAPRSRLRATLTKVEREARALVTHVSSVDGHGNAAYGLLSALAELEAQLALGPDPALRTCPTCEGIGMRAATRCSHCWTPLTPPD